MALLIGITILIANESLPRLLLFNNSGTPAQKTVKPNPIPPNTPITSLQKIPHSPNRMPFQQTDKTQTTSFPDSDSGKIDQEEIAKWASWQKRMESEYVKASGHETKNVLVPKEKANTWKIFLETFPLDNPHSDRDESLRQKAQARYTYWQNWQTAHSPLKSGRLYVNPLPKEARIRIMNIKPRYKRGIELKPGKYLVEVSREGYNTASKWIALKEKEALQIDIELTRVEEVITDNMLNTPVVSTIQTQPDTYSQTSESVSRSSTKSTPERIVFYNVRPEDTMKKISSRTGISVETLSRLNNIEINSPLQQGSRLILTGKQAHNHIQDNGTTAVARPTSRFATSTTGIITDNQTGLEWYVGPDKDTDWNEANAWVENLRIGGGGWRMPTINELQNLYKKGQGTRNMDPVFNTTGWNIWSGNSKGSKSAWLFGFSLGIEYFLGHWDTAGRAFAVRSSNSLN